MTFPIVVVDVPSMAGETWAPLCMSDAEWRAWQALNPFYSKHNPLVRKSDVAARPCADCPLGYAAEMRALGRCNGTPAGVQDDEEEPAMQVHASTPRPANPVVLGAGDGQRRRELDVALDLPCPACIHREVCRIREGLEARLTTLPVLMPELDEALSVKVDAKVDCALFRPERPAKRGGGASRELSPAELAARQRAAAIMREHAAAKRAQRAAERDGGVTG